MIVRLIKPEDMSRIEEIHRQHMAKFPLPDFSNPVYFAKGVAVDSKDNIVGVGAVKITSEVILMLDRTFSLTERVHATEQLLIVGKACTVKAGIPDWHAFIKEDDKFVSFVTERFGFKVLDSKTLYLRLVE